MLSIGKVGAYINHFLAWDISTGLLCGLLLFRLLATWETRARLGKRVSLILVVLLVSTALLPSAGLAGALLPNSERQANSQYDAEVIRILRTTPGPVLSENLLLLFQAGKAVEIEPATLSFIASAGRWDERRYVGVLDQQYFRLLVTYDIHAAIRFTPAVAATIERAYVLQQKVGRYTIYRPAPATEKTK
jgi:hypothetical protein